MLVRNLKIKWYITRIKILLSDSILLTLDIMIKTKNTKNIYGCRHTPKNMEVLDTSNLIRIVFGK